MTGAYFHTSIPVSGDFTYVRDTVPVEGTFNFYVSNKGLDSNNGISTSTPKLSIDGISTLLNINSALNSPVSLGLEGTSKFREELDIRRDQITVGSYSSLTGKKTANMTGMDIIKDWKATQGKNNVYDYSISHSIDLGSPNYHYIFIAEIDTALEKLYPVSSVKYMPLVSTIDQCEAIPGSFYTAPLSQNPISMYIHATEGIPGRNRFRYEVVRRPYTINSFYYNNCTFENLYLQSSGNGYGMLGAGENTIVRNTTFQGGGTHHAVIKSGLIDHSVFLPGPKGLTDEIAIVFYKPAGSGSSNKINNTVFFDIKNPVLTHTDGASSYKSLVIDSVYAFGDTLNTNTMLSTSNTDSVFISNSYCTGYKNFWVGIPRYLHIENSIINKVTEPAIYLGSGIETACNAVVSNTLIITNSNDANQGLPQFQPSSAFRFGFGSTSLKVSNTVFYGYSTWNTKYTTETVFDNSVFNKLEAYNNIYICEVNPENSLHIMSAGNSSGIGQTSNAISDYNVYIAVKGNIYWTAYPNSPQGDGNIYTLQDWQAFSGQDQHSIFIDLRNNPAGLKAIFTDPENGNWTLAQTPQADSIRKLNAGLLTPPLYFPLRPVYEDALDYTLPGGLSTFTGSKDVTQEVKLNWNTINEPHLIYFGIESGTDKTNFTPIGNVQSLGRYKNNQYNFTCSDSSSAKIYYRLRLMKADSSYSYSSTISVVPSKKDSIINGIGNNSSIGLIIYPNPVQFSLMVEHPARDQAEISVYDYTGRMLIYMPVQKKSVSTLLPVQNLSVGKYVIKWRSGTESKAVPFIKGK